MTSNTLNSKSVLEGKSLIEHLKEYKEFIAILVFFVSGFMWIIGYFATKHELEVMRCTNNLNIFMVEKDLQKKIFSDKLAINSIKYQKLAEIRNKTDMENERFTQLGNDIEMIKSILKMVEVRYEESFTNLKSNACEHY